jgi:NADH-quinone oxidoreductase E subunit
MRAFLEQRYLPRFPTKRAALLPALHLIQHAYGWIPSAALEEVAAFLEIAPAEALDTASFYEEYWLKPKGKYLIQVCRSLACELRGGREITEALRVGTATEVNETSADGKVTLTEVECLGACGTAPVMMCNGVLSESLTPEIMAGWLASLPENPHDYHDPTITWDDHDPQDPTSHPRGGGGHHHG